MTIVNPASRHDALLAVLVESAAHDAELKNALPALGSGKPSWATSSEPGFNADWQPLLSWRSSIVRIDDVEVNLSRSDTMVGAQAWAGELEVFVACDEWDDGLWVEFPESPTRAQMEAIGRALIKLSEAL